MKRAQRLEQVQRVVDDQERRRAETLAACECRLTESESKLAELQSYHANYVRDFTLRCRSGMDSAALRDFQTFLARLEEALRQQTLVVTRARATRDGELQNWQGAAQRAQVVGQMVKRFQTEEIRELERREQHEADERSQRAWTYGLASRGI
ncbi:MAG TPA: flagellar export protein FliJ [Steroidobacteraceae bacterium]|nr:flagellar export protein FliJ [Steroidobacteraceae bacterium]